LSVATSRTQALEDGLQASLARLDATRTGLQAGDRTTLDVLNAENDAAAAELALLQARVGMLAQRLQLAATAGRLDESELASANRALAQDSAH
jgi:outer membrane protein